MKTPEFRIKNLKLITVWSIDGVSQSIGTTQSAMFGGASARIEAYGKDLKEVLLPALRQKFGGLRLVVI